MGEYQNLKLVFTYLENETGDGIINRGLRPTYCKTQTKVLQKSRQNGR